jgi:hypothetical protein
VKGSSRKLECSRPRSIRRGRHFAGAGQFPDLSYPLYQPRDVIVTDLSRAETSRLGLRRLGAAPVGALCGAWLNRSFAAFSEAKLLIVDEPGYIPR